MSEYNTPHRNTYPLVSQNDTLVMVFRDHIVSGARPVLYVKALGPTDIRVDDSPSLDLRSGLRVVDYTAGAGDALTITVNGVATTFTEGVDFAAVASNSSTALNIAAAIDAFYGGVDIRTVRNDDRIYLETTGDVRTLTVTSTDLTAWNSAEFATWGAVVSLVVEETTAIDLPSTGVDPSKKVSVLHVLSGCVSADLRSTVPSRTYFQMPYALRATTGHPGGWPTSP